MRNLNTSYRYYILFELIAINFPPIEDKMIPKKMIYISSLNGYLWNKKY